MDVALAMGMTHGMLPIHIGKILFCFTSTLMVTQEEGVVQGESMLLYLEYGDVMVIVSINSHQTGWTALAVRCLDKLAEK